MHLRVGYQALFLWLAVDVPVAMMLLVLAVNMLGDAARDEPAGQPRDEEDRQDAPTSWVGDVVAWCRLRTHVHHGWVARFSWGRLLLEGRPADATPRRRPPGPAQGAGAGGARGDRGSAR